jgi:hypothetical protein
MGPADFGFEVEDIIIGAGAADGAGIRAAGASGAGGAPPKSPALPFEYIALPATGP